MLRGGRGPPLPDSYQGYASLTAIFRTSQLVHQETHAVLYDNNFLVLLDLDTSDFDLELLFTFAKSVPLNILHPDAPMPLAAVHIKQ